MMIDDCDFAACGGGCEEDVGLGDLSLSLHANWKREGHDVRTSQFVLLSWYFISKDRGLTLKKKRTFFITIFIYF